MLTDNGVRRMVMNHGIRARVDDKAILKDGSERT
jgi:hypothetical protein